MRVLTVIVVIIALAITAGSADAQAGECGQGLPCGPIPWRLPQLPALQSPTPMPTAALTAIPPTATPGGPTSTPGPTATTNPLDIDTSPISDQLATLSAVIASTPLAVYNAEGTPVDIEQQFDEMSQNAGVFFGYAQGLGTGFGPISPLIVFTITAFLVVLSVKILTFLMPVFAAVFGILRKVINTILEFIPL